ncbi:unnamed protein product [Cuscuta epithymum]|uniref:Uncharacterized protein n=1 Tax=Cuscuta epithymum TaxID=186058 RepID=A0AAV0FRS5_9ASTE|nr:unnamed protein product [Cuscuta epithymum]
MNLQSGKRKLTAREFKELVTSQARRVRAKDDMQTKSLSVHNFDDHTQELTSTCDSQHRNSKEDNNGTEGEESKCLICSNGGRLLCCAGKGCRRNFHPCCVDPPLKYFPLGTWYCISCVKKKVELGVYAVSEGVESVFDCRDNNYDNEVTHKQKKVEKEYLVKYKGLAHIHNRWIPERVLILEAPTMLAQFKKFNKKVSWKKDWTMPHRLLEKRLLLLPGASEMNSLWHNGDGSDSHYEWLVKWMGLDYDQATWELETASCLNSPVALKMISDYERLRKKPNLMYVQKIMTRVVKHLFLSF